MSMDWPVAQIPQEPVANHPAGILMPLRWKDHGDLRILVDADELDVFVSSDDLYALAEYEDTEHHPHPTLLPVVTWSRNPGDPLVEMFTLADAVLVLEHAPTHQTRELLDWIRVTVPLVLNDEVLDNAVNLESFCDAYTVRQAAMILDRDPAIAIGQNTLFQHLDHIGWSSRDWAGHWRPSSHALRHKLLTIRDVTIRSGTRAAAPYPQLYITPAGLAELRRTLHALDRTPVAPTAPETLPIPE